ncbi:Single-stranded DNA-binding protein WHY1, chloroplastic-like protein [Drosera capensis]
MALSSPLHSLPKPWRNLHSPPLHSLHLILHSSPAAVDSPRSKGCRALRQVQEVGGVRLRGLPGFIRQGSEGAGLLVSLQLGSVLHWRVSRISKPKAESSQERNLKVWTTYPRITSRHDGKRCLEFVEVVGLHQFRMCLEGARKVFTNYRVYEGKAVLDLEPKPPELAPLGTGLFKVAKEGYILLQMAPASAQRHHAIFQKIFQNVNPGKILFPQMSPTSYVPIRHHQNYDLKITLSHPQHINGGKTVFLLSVTEIGSLVNFGPEESCEIFHDPNMGRRPEKWVISHLRSLSLASAIEFLR